jgi:putative two-component system hydrogenase maturation factor HypX/HoxX
VRIGHVKNSDSALPIKLPAVLALAMSSDIRDLLATKSARRKADEAARPLERYREDELAHMRRNFYGFDPSYHVARHHFVHKTPPSWTPRHLAKHRELGWQVPAD